MTHEERNSLHIKRKVTIPKVFLKVKIPVKIAGALLEGKEKSIPGCPHCKSLLWKINKFGLTTNMIPDPKPASAVKMFLNWRQ